MPQPNRASSIIDYLSSKELSKRRPETYAQSGTVSKCSGFLIPPQEEQIDRAFNRGTKLICDLLSEGKIDSDIATEVLAHFVELYAEHKVESVIKKFLTKQENKPLVNALGVYLENK